MDEFSNLRVFSGQDDQREYEVILPTKSEQHKTELKDIFKISSMHAKEALKERNDLKTLQNKMFLDEASRYATLIASKIKDSIDSTDELREEGFTKERISILAIYVMFEEMSNKDEDGTVIKSLLTQQNLIMYLYQKFEIRNTTSGESCSVNDNVWLYDFITKVTEVFTLVKHKITSKDLLYHKNVFIMLLSIMHQNYAEHVALTPGLRSDTTQSEVEKELEKIKKEYKENITTVRNKIISIITGSSPLSFDVSSISEIITDSSEKTIREVGNHMLNANKKIDDLESYIVEMSEDNSQSLQIIKELKQSIDGALAKNNNPEAFIASFEMIKQDLENSIGEKTQDFKEQVSEALAKILNVLSPAEEFELDNTEEDYQKDEMISEEVKSTIQDAVGTLEKKINELLNNVSSRNEEDTDGEREDRTIFDISKSIEEKMSKIEQTMSNNSSINYDNNTDNLDKDDMRQLKNDIIESSTVALKKVIEENNQKQVEIISTMQNMVASIGEKTEDFKQKTSIIDQLFTRIEDLEAKLLAKDDIIIKMLEEQNKEARETLAEIKSNGQ